MLLVKIFPVPVFIGKPNFGRTNYIIYCTLRTTGNRVDKRQTIKNTFEVLSWVQYTSLFLCLMLTVTIN